MEDEEVLEQEPVVEEVNETPEKVDFEEPEVNKNAEPVEPLQINTHGQWETLEHFMQQELEVGKTYHIAVKGHCQFMISAEKPTAGIATNEITFTKQDGLKLWIKTGE